MAGSSSGGLPLHPRVEAWAERYERERRGRGMVFNDLVEAGVEPEEANELAKELVHTALQKVLDKHGQNPGKFEDYDHFRRYVNRTARNTTTDWLRKHRPGRFPVEYDPTDDHEDRGCEKVQKALKALNPKEEQILREHYEDELTLDQLADQYFPPPDARTPAGRRSAVWRLIREALDALEDALRNMEL